MAYKGPNASQARASETPDAEKLLVASRALTLLFMAGISAAIGRYFDRLFARDARYVSCLRKSIHLKPR